MDELSRRLIVRDDARSILTRRVVAHRDAVERLAGLRAKLAELEEAVRTTAADVSTLVSDRDDALRDGRKAGISFRELEQITGLSRTRLDFVVHNRYPDGRTKAAGRGSSE